MDAADFLPAIREVATYRVGKYRTDREDIARILFEFGVMGTTAYVRLYRNFVDTPIPQNDLDRVDDLWERAERTGLSRREAERRLNAGSKSRYAIERSTCELSIDTIYSKYPLACDHYKAWIKSHSRQLKKLCLTVADEILAERSQKS